MAIPGNAEEELEGGTGGQFYNYQWPHPDFGLHSVCSGMVEKL